MKFYTWVVAALLLSGCAGTQSRQAFTPRAAAWEPPAFGPNQAAVRNKSLQDCIDNNIRAYEILDEPPVQMQGE